MLCEVVDCELLYTLDIESNGEGYQYYMLRRLLRNPLAHKIRRKLDLSASYGILNDRML